MDAFANMPWWQAGLALVAVGFLINMGTKGMGNMGRGDSPNRRASGGRNGGRNNTNNNGSYNNNSGGYNNNNGGFNNNNHNNNGRY